MIKWSAFAPRRARDPIAWLQARGILTRDALVEALLELKIEPGSFPEEALQQHLLAIRSTEEREDHQPQSQPFEEQSAPAASAPAEGRRLTRRGGKLSQPT